MRSRIRVVGGAPPPPLDFAPQRRKNRRNSAPKRAGFWRLRSLEDQTSMRGGEGGIHGHYPIEPHIGGLGPGDTRVDYSGREWISE